MLTKYFDITVSMPKMRMRVYVGENETLADAKRRARHEYYITHIDGIAPMRDAQARATTGLTERTAKWDEHHVYTGNAIEERESEPA